MSNVRYEKCFFFTTYCGLSGHLFGTFIFCECFEWELNVIQSVPTWISTAILWLFWGINLYIAARRKHRSCFISELMDASKPETNERMTCVLMCRDIWELWESERRGDKAAVFLKAMSPWLMHISIPTDKASDIYW